MKCINVQCQKDIGEMLFCPYCGTKQVKPKVFCAYCGAEMDEDAVFCDNCGRKSFLVQQREEAELEKQKRLAKEAERKRLEEEQKAREEKEKAYKRRLAADWTVLDDPDLAFKIIDGKYPSLGVKGFDASSARSEIAIPSYVSILGVDYKVAGLADDAFSGFANLKSMVLPDGLEVIPARAFKDCTALCSIKLPETVEAIGEEAFAGSGLSGISLPKSLEFIDYDAFRGCRQLSNVVFPGEPVKVQNTSFDLTPFVKTPEYMGLVSSKTIVKLKCSEPELSRFEKENIFASRDYPYLIFVFSPKARTITVSKKKGSDLPAELIIPRNAFIGNFLYPVVNLIGFESSNTLERLVIPASGDKINICKKAFAGCSSLESIEIHSKEMVFYSGAFENCTSLKEVELKFVEKPHISVTAFSGCSALPMMKRLKLVKYHDIRVDLASI